jgi:hypothetical protein
VERGYIKVWRKLEDSGLLQMPNTLALFMFLLMKVTRTERKVGTSTGVITLRPGQYIGGRKKLAEMLEQGEQQIRTSLERLEAMEILTSSVTSRYSVYTIVNYELYQQNDDKVTSSQPALQPTDNQQVTTKQEIKKYTKTYSPEFQAFWDAYPQCDRKGGRPAAYEVWKRLSLDEKSNDVIQHMKSTMASRELKYVSAPDVYLKKQGWDGWDSGAMASDNLFEGAI